MRIISALAACIAVALGIWKFQSSVEPAAQVYTTASGGYQRVLLPDESVVALNADTQVRIRLSAKSREVTLVRGEAHFTVAKNPARPFVVGAGKFAVRAVGTAFAVRFAPAEVDVLVTEGRVQVSQGTISAAVASSRQTATPETPLLEAGQRLVVQTDPVAPGFALRVTPVSVAETRTALAWHNPLLTFSGSPLSEVVQQFNRHNRLQLEIGDPELSGRGVGGTFYANNVETFVNLLETSRDIAVERPDPHRIVLRKVKAAR